MEKLIRLLDEYHHKKTEDLERWKERVEEHKHWIISKQFWFIKRLVDNDKIDLWKLIMIKDEEQKAIVDIDNSRENTLLMLLAISNEPIEFLISILK